MQVLLLFMETPFGNDGPILWLMLSSHMTFTYRARAYSYWVWLIYAADSVIEKSSISLCYVFMRNGMLCASSSSVHNLGGVN